MSGGDELLRLALSRPADAVAQATVLLENDPDPKTASIAHQARAIVVRDSGRFDEAVAELRLALRLARNCGEPARAIDVQATLGAALVMGGHTAAGLATLDGAVAASTGRLAGRVLARRGTQLVELGRRTDALADLNRAVVLLHRAADHVWEARARTSRFSLYADVGQAGRADRDLAIAARLYAQAGQELESATAVHNRADVAIQAGDLPAALGFLDDAAARYAELDFFSPDLVFDRCKVLLAAGLATEALAVADAGVERHPAGRSIKKPELLFVAARAAQAAGLPAEAAMRAALARKLFRAQGRSWWQTRASFVLVQSRYDAGDRSGRLRAMASRVADRLDELSAEEAPTAHLLAGRLAAAQGRMADADRHLARAARYRVRGPTFGRAAGWLAQALRAEARAATAATLSACRRGLAAAADHQRSLGAVELRTHAASYGTELAAIGQRHAVRRGDARMLLLWSERWRASALASMSSRPPEDPALAADLAALRQVMKRIEAARSDGSPVNRLESVRRRLEETIRSRTRRTAGGDAHRDHRPGSRAALDQLLQQLDDHLLVELVALDGTLHAVTAHRGRVRAHAVGSLAAAVREVELVRFMLRRLSRGRPAPGALARIDLAGSRLQEALLGPAVRDIHGGPTIIVPPGSLHAVPWAILPALRDTAVRIAPSATTWMRARADRPRRPRRTVLVIGPGLSGTFDEVTRIASRYEKAIVLGDGTATAGRVLAALDGAWTAHVAAHGVFRADNPLFSSLRLHDGPLTVYDLAGLRRAPHRLILSSCDSGVASPINGDELLGTISTLVPRGTTSLLASIVPVNDVVTGALMADFHTGLRSGAGFAEALRDARTSRVDDPVALATALSFVALGR
jgi:CHAT domain-containing protein